MTRDDWKDIWVYLETMDGMVEPVSWEILGKGRELADSSGEGLIGIILGKGTGREIGEGDESEIRERDGREIREGGESEIRGGGGREIGEGGESEHRKGTGSERGSWLRNLAGEAIRRGADKVLVADDPLLERYSWEAYTKVTADLVKDRKPSILLMGATHNGRELAGRLAVRLDTGLTADVVRLEIDHRGLLLSAVPGFGGSILAIIECEHSRPQMSTVRPGIFTALDPDPSRKGEIENITVDLDPDEIKTHLVERIRVAGEDISKAERLVAAGRGAGSDLDTIRELADILDAAVGVTRPLADVGVMSRDFQIGSTGVTVKPDLALVAGASGAIHFVSGIQDSGTIISINIDPNAQIFHHSDYCVVGEVNEILSALVKELEERETKGRELDAREPKKSELKEEEIKERELDGRKQKESELKEREIKGRKLDAREPKKSELKEGKIKGRMLDEREPKKSELKEREIKGRMLDEREPKKSELKEREMNVRELKDRQLKNMKHQEAR